MSQELSDAELAKELRETSENLRLYAQYNPNVIVVQPKVYELFATIADRLERPGVEDGKATLLKAAEILSGLRFSNGAAQLQMIASNYDTIRQNPPGVPT